MPIADCAIDFVLPKGENSGAGHRKESKMAEIRIDADKAERMISQILRDEKGLLPADANAVAANICRRLTTAMPMPTNPAIAGLPNYFGPSAGWWR
jgi:hypothetical protein